MRKDSPSCPDGNEALQTFSITEPASDIRPDCNSNNEFDLLRLAPVRRLILWAGFPYVIQVLMLGVFIGLAVMSWGVFTPNGASPKLYAKTNLATLLVWGIWWPAMIWVAVLFGRAWCMVCPLELVSNLGERFARSVRLPQRPLRKWIASGSIIVGLYTLIQMFVSGAHINRVPAYTSFFLIGLLGMAVLTGLAFKDRAFCRGFCPVGLLLGVYGRGGMLAVRAGTGAKCEGCTGIGIRPGYWRLDYPMNMPISRRTSTINYNNRK